VNQLISQLVFLKVLAFHIRDDLFLEGFNVRRKDFVILDMVTGKQNYFQICSERI